jgi:hypothetical protein
MKLNTLIWNLAIAFMLLVGACSEDIDLSPDGKETAIVYGLLDQNDTIHYIRINRAFYGGTNAVEVAQIPDSNYFKKVDAFIYEVFNGDTLRTWKLRDTLISNKDTNGVFFAPLQKLYYFTTSKSNPLINNQGSSYHLAVSIDNNRFSVNGQTSLIRNAKIGNPASEGNAFSFASTSIAQYGYYPTTVNLSPGTAQKLNVKLDIYINEFIGNLSSIKKITWDLGTKEVSTGIASAVSASGEMFYQKIAEACTNKAVTKRQLYRIDINAMFVPYEFIQYEQSLVPSSSIAQSKQDFTNLTVTNGMRVKGLFSSRNNIIVQKLPFKQYSASFYYRAIDQSSMKELCQGQYTGGLNFCSDVPSDSKESFFCN